MYIGFIINVLSIIQQVEIGNLEVVGSIPTHATIIFKSFVYLMFIKKNSCSFLFFQENYFHVHTAIFFRTVV
jgi:hypothetical protein